MASPIKLAHVVFRTGRLPEMVNWYCTVLAARVAYANDFVAFNPIGVTFDADTMSRRFRDGESVAELTKYPV